ERVLARFFRFQPLLNFFLCKRFTFYLETVIKTLHRLSHTDSLMKFSSRLMSRRYTHLWIDAHNSLSTASILFTVSDLPLLQSARQHEQMQSLTRCKGVCRFLRLRLAGHQFCQLRS